MRALATPSPTTAVGRSHLNSSLPLATFVVLGKTLKEIRDNHGMGRPLNLPSPTRTRYNAAMIRKWLILTAGGAIGAVLSVWFLDDWVWGTVFDYAHGHGERLVKR